MKQTRKEMKEFLFELLSEDKENIYPCFCGVINAYVHQKGSTKKDLQYLFLCFNEFREERHKGCL